MPSKWRLTFTTNHQAGKVTRGSIGITFLNENDSLCACMAPRKARGGERSAAGRTL